MLLLLLWYDKYKQHCSRQKHLLLIEFEKLFKCNRSYFHLRISHWYCICTILLFVDRASLYNLINKASMVHNFCYYVYFFFLHVSGDYVPIIRRNSCIYGTLGTCYFVWITGMLEHMLLHTRQSSIQNNK